MSFFASHELNCPCCNDSYMNDEFMDKLNALRSHCNFPFYLTSAFRCNEHNKAIGGAEKSSHLLGRAVDISCKNSDMMTILENARRFGFNGIGIGSGFCHLDDNHTYTSVWSY